LYSINTNYNDSTSINLDYAQSQNTVSILARPSSTNVSGNNVPTASSMLSSAQLTSQQQPSAASHLKSKKSMQKKNNFFLFFTFRNYFLIF
jgi:hypothetical protein